MKSKSSTDENYPFKNSSSVDKKILKNLNKKYGPVNKNFVKGEINSFETNESVNKGHNSNRKLKKKLDAIETKPDEVKTKSNNRNGKIGVNKHNNYTPNASAPRKTCSKCGSVNHLSTNCKTLITLAFFMPMYMPSVSNLHMPAMNMMPGLLPQNPYTHPNMPYMFNPYFNAFNMSQFHSSMPGMNNLCVPQMTNKPTAISNVNVLKAQPKPNIESNLSEGKVKIDEKVVKSNKPRPKRIWVPKST